MFREALDYPTRPPRGGRSVLVGGTLLLLVVAVGAAATLDPPIGFVAILALLPWLLARGYYVRVIRSTIGREFPTPPPFGDVRALLRDGVAAALIAVGYLLPGAAVLAPFVYARTRDADLVTLLLGDGVSPSVATGVTAGAGILALFAVFSILGALYALPVAVARYAHVGRFGAAFELRAVAGGAATEDYVVAWVVSLLLQALLLPFAYLLKPILIGFYLHFLIAVGVRYCYGQGVGAVFDLDPVESAAPGRVPGRGPDTDEEAHPERRAGHPRPAVRPIEETDRPELVGAGSNAGPDAAVETGSDDTSRSNDSFDPDDSPKSDDADGSDTGDRPEGERT